MKKFTIAIDGPAGAGKSTVARLIARKLQYIYIDTGAMFRAVAWLALQNGLGSNDTEKIASLAQTIRIQLVPQNSGELTILVNDQDVTMEIRSQAVTNLVAKVAQISEVRSVLLELQRNLAAQGGVVMDGRDIGTRVLPQAEVKFYLTASIEARAKRRYDEMIGKGEAVQFEQLKAEIALRDKEDMNRKEAPLVKASDALLVDSSSMTIDEVVQTMIRLSAARVKQRK